MKKLKLGLVALLLVCVGVGCKIEHTKTVSEEPGGGTATEHSVKLKETISDKEKGVELYKQRTEDEPKSGDE